MKAVEFCYWLQGMFELSNIAQLNKYQTNIIRKHLALVFKHEIDPSYGSPQHQEELSVIHNDGSTANTIGLAPHFPPQSSNRDELLRC
jgi:hypothetical protein